MKSTEIKVEDMFGGLLGKDSFSPEKITKLN